MEGSSSDSTIPEKGVDNVRFVSSSEDPPATQRARNKPFATLATRAVTTVRFRWSRICFSGSSDFFVGDGSLIMSKLSSSSSSSTPMRSILLPSRVRMRGTRPHFRPTLRRSSSVATRYDFWKIRVENIQTLMGMRDYKLTTSSASTSSLLSSRCNILREMATAYAESRVTFSKSMNSSYVILGLSGCELCKAVDATRCRIRCWIQNLSYQATYPGDGTSKMYHAYWVRIYILL
jgi:hypothetical protein